MYCTMCTYERDLQAASCSRLPSADILYCTQSGTDRVNIYLLFVIWSDFTRWASCSRKYKRCLTVIIYTYTTDCICYRFIITTHKNGDALSKVQTNNKYYQKFNIAWLFGWNFKTISWVSNLNLWYMLSSKYYNC